jgi:hypothetical protein
MPDTQSETTSSAVFVIRQALNEIYVAPSEAVAVSHVRKHYEANPSAVKLADFMFFRPTGQELTLLTTSDGYPAGLANLDRVALEDLVWKIIRSHQDDIKKAREESDNGTLLGALASESITFDELTQALAALAGAHGPDHVHIHDAGEDVVPLHQGSPLHNLCHALHICS